MKWDELYNISNIARYRVYYNLRMYLYIIRSIRMYFFLLYTPFGFYFYYHIINNNGYIIINREILILLCVRRRFLHNQPRRRELTFFQMQNAYIDLYIYYTIRYQLSLIIKPCHRALLAWRVIIIYNIM